MKMELFQFDVECENPRIQTWKACMELLLGCERQEYNVCRSRQWNAHAIRLEKHF